MEQEVLADHLQDISMEQLLESLLKAEQEKEQLEASMNVIKSEMILRLDAENIKGKVVQDYSVTKVTRTNFKPTLEQARELAATKTVEQIDTQALKNLYAQGVEIPNMSTTTFLVVKPLEKAN